MRAMHPFRNKGLEMLRLPIAMDAPVFQSPWAIAVLAGSKPFSALWEPSADVLSAMRLIVLLRVPPLPESKRATPCLC